MKWTSLNDLREMFLSFYEEKGHLRHKSFPLVPIGDKSLLLINAGMAPLKKYFTGEEEPPRRRMTTCQKCIRTPDIERVGITARHGTYFEMLGNFSFGDYFKTEAIHWAWEFITTRLELPEDRLWVTIYENDDEAFSIWNKQIGIPEEKIVRLGKEDNFWEIGSGPCGPCSEIYFDRGEKYGCGKPDCKPGCDCDRFMEFWNLVFTQFDGDGKGGYTPLEHPNIDTGMGLERLACLMQGVNNLFEVDTVRNIMKAVSERAGIQYGADPKTDISLRVVTDHIRSTAFLVCDGVIPSNEGRGYVLRRLLRRAARHGKLLGIKGEFLADLCRVVAKENENAYPELTEKLDYIMKIVSLEEQRFNITIDSGLDKLTEIIDRVKKTKERLLAGGDIFKLSDTFGFPIDLTREIAGEHGLGVDEDGFRALMDEQKERARNARSALGDYAWSAQSYDFLDKSKKTVFTGYDVTENEAEIIALIDPATGEAVDSTDCGEVIIVLDKTPFYAESGGQVADTGIISCGENRAVVVDVKKHDGFYLHRCETVTGVLSVADKAKATVDSERREAIRRNHSAAHLLQAALRQVLGNHVEQAGSYVDDTRVRFDFSHFAPLSHEELDAVEMLVNKEILRGDQIATVETDIESAKKMGAMALFGEKYGATVRVVKMGNFSTEFCGGTHQDNTAKIGLFKIISESGVAAGVRRIEATTGLGILELFREKENLIHETARELKIGNIAEMAKKAVQVQRELHAAYKQIEALNAKMASAQTEEIMKEVTLVHGIKVITKSTKGIAIDVARGICDKVKSELPDAVIVLSTDIDGKLNFICAAGKDAVAAGVHAGNILKTVSPIAGGNGGGRPDSATSGGKDASKVDDALKAVYATVESMVK